MGRYGDTLRKLTALQAQAGGFSPQQVGGADTGGFGPSLQLDPQARPAAPAFDPEPQQQQAAPAPSAAPAAAPSGFGGAPPDAGGMPAGNEPWRTPGINGDAEGPLSNVPGIAGPIKQGGDKPTSFGDLASNATDDEKEELAAQVEKQSGAGGLKAAFGRIKEVLGAKTPETKMKRHDMALYVAEVALRAMSKRSDPAYAQNPDGVFADAVLETQAGRDATAEKTRVEGRADTETKRKETREDTTHTRDRTEKEGDHVRDRKEKIEDDERNHKQALELAKYQAKLLKEKGQRTSIQTADDGTLTLIDLDSGNAIDVTKEVTETSGSRGNGTTTKKKRVPVKAAPKFNAGGLDQDTLVNRVSDAEKALRGNRKLMRELGSKYENDTVKIEAELRKMAREKVEGDVESLGAGASGVTDFNDLK